MKRIHDLPDRAKFYAEPHDHRRYGHGHHMRCELTKTIAREYSHGMESVADLSCGNGYLAKSLCLKRTVLGDFAPGYELHGPIEETIHKLQPVDMFICSETIEHLEAPQVVLADIRPKASKLVLSTPLEAWEDTNEEHLWAWDRKDVETLAKAAGWEPAVFVTLDSRVFGEPYLYGIWVLQ